MTPWPGAATRPSTARANAAPRHEAGWRTALWIALAINAGMFLTETVAGVAAGSASLPEAGTRSTFPRRRRELRDRQPHRRRDGATWRARAALLKGATLGLLGVWVLGSTLWHAYTGTLPRAEVMGVIGAVLALITNGGVALMLYRFRGGDANMRSVWICSRNDAIEQWSRCSWPRSASSVPGTGWPDIIVAGTNMAALGYPGGLADRAPCLGRTGCCAAPGGIINISRNKNYDNVGELVAHVAHDHSHAGHAHGHRTCTG